MKRKLTVEVIKPEDWDEDAFHKHVADVMFEVWKDICPKELQAAAMKRAIEKLES